MLLASFAIVFPVQGATTIISVSFLGPIGSASETDINTLLPQILSARFICSCAVPKRVSVVPALNDIIGSISQPASRRASIAANAFENVQKEPVIQNPTLTPLNSLLKVTAPFFISIKYLLYCIGYYLACGFRGGFCRQTACFYNCYAVSFKCLAVNAGH